MKRPLILLAALGTLFFGPVGRAGETKREGETKSLSEAVATAKQEKSNAGIEKKASEWVETLSLGDAEKAARVRAVITTHMKAVRDWHNSHPFEAVPEGINPRTGNPLTKLDRQMIADAAMPKTVHEALMSGLRKDLTEKQVEALLDKYTVGKVAFTLKGYKAIVPDLTAKEEAHILSLLEKAREEAVNYKSMQQISEIFEVYKTQCEQYLNANGRDWKALYKTYTAKIKAEKDAAKPAEKKP